MADPESLFNVIAEEIEGCDSFALDTTWERAEVVNRVFKAVQSYLDRDYKMGKVVPASLPS